MKDGFRAHRMETDFCKQANMPKTFEGGYPNPRYKNCLACSGNDAERGAMDRAGRACISMLNGSVDPTGGAQFWWTKGRSPGWIKNNPKCKLVTIPGCNLDIWKCSSEPLASDTQKPPTKPKKPKK